MARGSILLGWVFVIVGVTPISLHAYGLGAGGNDHQLTRLAQHASAYLAQSQLGDGRWEWRVGSQFASDSYNGLVAESLLAAYEQTGQTVYVQSAERFATYLLARQAALPNSLPYEPDIEFLVRVTEVTGNETYAQAAARWFGSVLRLSPTGAMEVARIVNGRKGTSDIVGYDVALGIRAALALGETDYANELALAVWQQRGQWLRQPQSTFGTISRAALLDALTMLGGHKSMVETLQAELLREQTDNGSWCFNETQATAYAVRALSQQRQASTRAAAQKGSRWLSQTVLQRGAWAHFNDGVPEPFVGDVISAVNAEALTAVILANQF